MFQKKIVFFIHQYPLSLFREQNLFIPLHFAHSFRKYLYNITLDKKIYGVKIKILLGHFFYIYVYYTKRLKNIHKALTCKTNQKN